MLPVKYKLSPREIPLLARKGARYTGELFDIKLIKDRALDTPKLAITISTRVSKKAVVRNRIKRLMREAIQQLLNEDKINPGKYLIIMKSADTSQNAPADLAQVFLNQLDSN